MPWEEMGAIDFAPSVTISDYGPDSGQKLLTYFHLALSVTQ